MTTKLTMIQIEVDETASGQQGDYQSEQKNQKNSNNKTNSDQETDKKEEAGTKQHDQKNENPVGQTESNVSE